MTNGEKFKEVFKISQVEEGELYAFAWLPNHDAAEISIDWWNAEYKEPTTKNDLGVDAVSRKAVLNTLDSMDSALDEDRTVEKYKELLKECYKVLPAVTPQEPKVGHCKDCKYFEYDSVAKVYGVPLILAHEICSKWGNGCKTKEDGYCFLFDPQESEDKEQTDGKE